VSAPLELNAARQAFAERAKAGRIVVKIGSGVITDAQARLDVRVLRRLADEIAPLASAKRWPVVVSSGAIAIGTTVLGLPGRPKTMPGLQAAAAVGQSRLMEAWADAFRPHELTVAQVLLTHADVADRRRFLNARRALGELCAHRVIAIANENDTVSTEEIAFGDNDQLAAEIANMVDAEVLVLMSVAPGLLDGAGQRLPAVHAADPSLDALIQPTKSRTGTGGMTTKLRSARAAAERGAFVAIVEGKRPGVLGALLAGEDVGTLLVPATAERRLGSRAAWIAHSLRPRGTLVVDAGAAKALLEGDKSLLPPGIVDALGDFDEGDAVEIRADGDPRPFARGLSRYDAASLRHIRGLPSSQIAERLGFTAGDAVVHKDDLVVL